MGALNPGDFLNDIAAADQIARLSRRLAREREARTKAEEIAERGLRALYLSQQRIELLQQIAAKANEATDTFDALAFAVAEICSHTGWAFGNAYVVDTTNPDSLIASQIWFAAQPTLLMPFINDSLERQFVRGLRVAT